MRQARHFRDITFPNKIYNPYKEEGYSMQSFLEANVARHPRRPAFLCGGWYHDELPAHLGGGIGGFKTWPVGPCDRIRPQQQELSLEQWVAEAGALTPDYQPPSADKYADGTWERVTLTDYWSARHKLPYSLLMWAIDNADNQPALHQAARMLQDLADAHPDPPDYFHKNAGIAYGRLRTPLPAAAGGGGTGQPNHCWMISHFAWFLLKTLEVPSSTAEIRKIVGDYVKHARKLEQAGAKHECAQDVLVVVR